MILTTDKRILQVIGELNNISVFQLFVQWMNDNAQSIGSDVIEAFPEKDDHNFDARYHFLRGFVSCLKAVTFIVNSSDEMLRKSTEPTVLDTKHPDINTGEGF